MVRTTSDQSGFDARLVEKDYYCSLMLRAHDFERFNLARIWDKLVVLADRLNMG